MDSIVWYANRKRMAVVAPTCQKNKLSQNIEIIAILVEAHFSGCFQDNV